ncbi:hypothetical protein B0J17DRAFT_662279 [Rhizoctonia solani]|nr:hypothetical protein B0J17DRAFT_662279 [Rhizoctonia solani]
MTAPGYTDSRESRESTPMYSALATDGERILELQPSLSTPSTNLPDRYVFQSQRIKLDLGARTWPVSAPCFGYRGSVEGVVSVTTLEYVKSVTVKVEATVKTFFMERGILSGHTEYGLFQRSVTLYNNGPESSEAALTYSFSINLPETCDKSTNPLPPSCICSLSEASAEIRYRVYVGMSRSGLRRRDSLTIPILYLPRFYIPLNTSSLPSENGQIGCLYEAEGMEELPLVPEIRNGGKRNASSIIDIQAKIALPASLLVVSGDRIPFIITIHSQSQALAALYTDISLQLVKITRIKAPPQASLKEEVLSFGEVYHTEEPGNGVRALRGELGSGVPGSELSWSAGGIVEVRHAIRLSLKPPSSTLSLSANLPIFERTIPVGIMTHRYAPDVDTALPALGLIGTSN